MITDLWFKMWFNIKKLFCHHEYVYQSAPDLVHHWYGYWYRCRKCGRITCDPPQKLIVSEEDKRS